MINFPDRMDDGKAPRAGAAGNISAFRLVAGIFILAALLGADVIWTVFEEGMSLVFQFVAERLEHFFLTKFHLDLYHAQMATAYSGLLIVLSVGFFLLRKLLSVGRHVRADASLWWHERSAGLVRDWHGWVSRIITWWHSLDLLNKCAVMIALVVMVIPVALLLSYGLGMAVAKVL